MQTVAMTHDERREFTQLEEKVETLETRLFKIDAKINSILNIVKGIAIGIAIGGLVFGFISIKDLITVAK